MADMNQMVDRITEEVLRELNRRGQFAPPPDVAAEEIVPSALAPMIDHTILKPDARREDVSQLCREALQHGFAAVCVNPFWVRQVAGILKGSAVKTCSVVGFPLGATPTDVKAYETRRAIFDGAQEIDMVINIGALKSGDFSLVEQDILEVVRVAAEQGAVVKVILETCLLSQEEKIAACQLARRALADFVKTSTGFSSGGATIDDVRLMKEIVGDCLKVKASGGIRSLADARAMIKAGANRIGTSSGVKIVGGQ